MPYEDGTNWGNWCPLFQAQCAPHEECGGDHHGSHWHFYGGSSGIYTAEFAPDGRWLRDDIPWQMGVG